jgi:hypothetical protein
MNLALKQFLMALKPSIDSLAGRSPLRPARHDPYSILYNDKKQAEFTGLSAGALCGAHK